MKRIGRFGANLGKALWNLALLLSIVVNVILVLVLIVVVQQIFAIKNGIGEPLIDGLHANFVGLNEATIITDIQVVDTIEIDFVLPINQQTVVVIQEPVPLNANASFNLPGGGGTINGTVSLSLPTGLALPVMLNMDVPVTQTIPISLNVPVTIPLNETELAEPFTNLRNLLEPYVRTLDNLPAEWSEVPNFVLDAAAGNVNLVSETEGSRNPWPIQRDTAADAPPLDAEGEPIETEPEFELAPSIAPLPDFEDDSEEGTPAPTSAAPIMAGGERPPSAGAPDSPAQADFGVGGVVSEEDPTPIVGTDALPTLPPTQDRPTATTIPLLVPSPTLTLAPSLTPQPSATPLPPSATPLTPSATPQVSPSATTIPLVLPSATP